MKFKRFGALAVAASKLVMEPNGKTRNVIEQMPPPVLLLEHVVSWYIYIFLFPQISTFFLLEGGNVKRDNCIPNNYKSEM